MRSGSHSPGRRLERTVMGNGTERAHQVLRYSSKGAAVSRLIYSCPTLGGADPGRHVCARHASARFP